MKKVPYCIIYIIAVSGKGGSRVRELQDDTGCRINVSINLCPIDVKQGL